jgi:hypothetical protein
MQCENENAPNARKRELTANSSTTKSSIARGFCFSGCICFLVAALLFRGLDWMVVSIIRRAKAREAYCGAVSISNGASNWPWIL